MIQALVINVESARARMSFQQEQLQSMGIAWERLPATTLDDIDTDANDAYWNGWQRPIAPAERACLRSHMTGWQMVNDNDAPYLILEDDALLANDLPDVLASATQLKNIDLLQLETRNRAKFLGTDAFPVGPVQARALLIDRAGAAGYVLWPTGAKKLLDYVAKTPGLADAIISKPGLLYAAQIIPAQVIQNDMAKTYKVHEEWPPETSSVSNASYRDVHKSAAQVFRRIGAQLSLAFHQLGHGEKVMVPFGPRSPVPAITTKKSSHDNALS